MSERVVVTGMGVISPIGLELNEFWDNVKEGKCGIGEITCFDTTEFKVKIGAELKNFDAEKFMDKKEVRRSDKYAQYAMAAAIMAVEQSGIKAGENVDANRFAVQVGSGIGGMLTTENEVRKMNEKGANRVSPLLVPMIITNIAAGNIAIRFSAKGICTTVVTACATGTNAIGDAFRLLKYGEADAVIAGSAEAPITPLAVSGFTNMTALTSSNDVNRASIPFDKERSGFVIGEGAGILVMETLTNAKKRGAKILGEVVGYGSTCDAYHITNPDPTGDGAARAMQLAIDGAGIKNEEVSYINAHGTSTPPNDMVETKAIKTVFGENTKIPVSSTKSMMGHLLGAAGSVEAIICLKALEDGFIPATINYKVPDEELDLDYVPNVGRNVNIKYALSNSLGFGGHNGSLLFKKWED